MKLHLTMNLMLGLAAFAGVLCTLAGCSAQKSGGTEQTSVGLESYSDVKAAYHDVINAFPLKVESDDVLARLVSAAVREGKVADSEALMRHSPDDNVGLFIFEKQYGSAREESPERALEFARKIESDFRGKPLSVLAFDKILDHLRTSEPDEFLRSCQEDIGPVESQGGPREAVALRRRAEYYYDTGEVKRSALDYLHFWGKYPEKVEKLGMKLVAMSRLQDAGLFWEASSLEISESPGEVARRFYDEFQGVEGTCGDSIVGSPDEIYWCETPKLEPLLARASESREVSLPEVELLARVGCLAMYTDRQRESAAIHMECGKRLLQIHDADGDVVLHDLRECYEVVYKNTLRIFSNYKNVEMHLETEYHFNSKNETELILALAKMGYKMALDGLPAGPNTAGAEREAVDRFVGAAKLLNDRNAVVEVYDDVVARHEGTEMAASYLLEIGDTYLNDWKTPEQAIEAYRKLQSLYPESPHAETALSKIALAYHGIEKYDDAYLACQEFEAIYPDGKSIAAVKMVSAMCESALGQNAEAEVHMQEIAEEYRHSNLAPRALFWIASNRLARQDYAAAKEAFEALIERYPESDFASQSREYVTLLDSVAEQSGR